MLRVCAALLVVLVDELLEIELLEVELLEVELLLEVLLFELKLGELFEDDVELPLPLPQPVIAMARIVAKVILNARIMTPC